MGHKECMYHDNDALLYAVAKLGEHDVILSARETEVYNEYLGYAKTRIRNFPLTQIPRKTSRTLSYTAV